MAMETLGGNLPPGRAAAVFAVGRTHVFAIAAGGTMSHWTSPDGVGWQGPVDLLQGGRAGFTRRARMMTPSEQRMSTQLRGCGW